MKFLRWFFIFCVLLIAAGCKGDDKPAASYTARGVIAQLPDDSGRVYIHHEAIPEFVNRAGDKQGMASMTMPFAVSSGVSLDGVAVGDKVEFAFAVYWKRDTPAHVTSIRELPESTQLELSGR